MKVYGAVLDGIDGKLIEVDSYINPKLKKSIKILGVKGVVIKDAAEAVMHVLPSMLPKEVEAKGLVTIDLIPPFGGGKSVHALALPIGVRAYIALMIQEAPELPPPPMEGASEEEIKKYQELQKNLKTQASLRAKILKHLEKDNSEYLLIGGIRLDGRLYAPERGLMGLISSAKDGMKVIVPSECAGYGYLAKLMLEKQGKKIHVIVAETFADTLHIIDGSDTSSRKVKATDLDKMEKYEMPFSDCHDFSEIIGQHKAKHALEIAAAGGHNVLLWGPMGEGKSTLANAVIKILPSIFRRKQTETFSALAEVNKIYTAKGLLKPNQFIDCRPFRPVSAKTGAPGLIGGGLNPEPGEISLAHCGVLMIDEFNFMDARTMALLLVPLENGYIVINKFKGTYRFPASFTLIGTMNPCKCSYWGEYECSICKKVIGNKNSVCKQHPEAKHRHRCRCSIGEIKPFQNFSGPILDRIELIVQTFSVDPYALDAKRESSADVKKRVEQAIKKQKERYAKSSNLRCNAEIKWKDIEENIIKMNSSAKRVARDILQEHGLNTRSYVRLHAVARTIADLKNHDEITDSEIIEAHQIIGDKNILGKV